jgi:hypothetical protein
MSYATIDTKKGTEVIISNETFIGFDFAAGDWSMTTFSGCTFDTDHLPTVLVEGGAKFINCKGPSA